MIILIRQTSDTPIRPKDIDTDDTLVGTFSERDLELSAFWVVRFCQARRSWAPFQLDALNRYVLANNMWTESDPLEDGLKSLVKEGLLKQDHLGLITLTTAFVATCYRGAPIQGLPRKRVKRPSKRVAKVSKYQRIRVEDPFSS